MNLSDATPETTTSMSHREYVKMEFYKTYDLMTGVRIAATLGSFFSVMVLLVVYKSQCKSRSLSEENLEAAVAAAAAEEQMGTAYSVCGARRSLGNVSAPFVYSRFSSFERFLPRGRVSLPTSSPYLYPTPLLSTIGSPPPTSFNKKYFDEAVSDKLLGGGHEWLQLPSRRGSRRLSSFTNSSCYLDRRGSVMDMPFSIPTSFVHNEELIEEPWQYFIPVNIQVTNPTPEISPCISRDSVYEISKWKLCVPAPLASVGSTGVGSSEKENHSMGSDSVFLDEELVDTEDEVEGFSTDSEADSNQARFSLDADPSTVMKPLTHSTAFKQHCSSRETLF